MNANKYSELDKLENYLKEHGYIYTRTDIRKPDPTIPEEILYERHRIDVFENETYKEIKSPKWDVICQNGSYGYEEGLLEIRGYPIQNPRWHDDVEGYLTAQQIIDMLEGSQELVTPIESIKAKEFIDELENMYYNERESLSVKGILETLMKYYPYFKA